MPAQGFQRAHLRQSAVEPQVSLARALLGDAARVLEVRQRSIARRGSLAHARIDGAARVQGHRQLHADHGAPLRLIGPNRPGVLQTKWVVELEVTRFDRASAYWTDRGWGEKGPIKIGSRIDVVRGGTGEMTVAGVAWHQHTGISGVEVQVDGGAWKPRFRPWPGERVTFAFARPTAAPGASTTIDRATVTVTYDADSLRHLDAAQIGLYRYDEGAGSWVALETTIDAEAMTAAGFNPHYLSDALNALDAPYVNFSFTAPGKPCLLTPLVELDGEPSADYKHVIMLMRLVPKIGWISRWSLGFIVGVTMLDLNFLEYYHQPIGAIRLHDLWVGLFMSAVFGVVIAAIGCRQGMEVGGDVESLGRGVTAAVVQAIFATIMIDAIFALIYMKLDI